LPINLTEASAAFAASELLQKSMGLLLHSSLVDSQKAEIKRCAGLCDEQLVVSSRWWPVVGAI
jgi:glutamine synthetase